MTARTGWLFARASERRSISSRPTPSDQAVPSAAAENGLQRPSGASPRSRENSTKPVGVDMTAAPPARARSHSPARSAFAARCRATREEEHAVSIATAGPSKPKV